MPVSPNLKECASFIAVRKNYLDGKKPYSPDGKDWNDHLFDWENANCFLEQGFNIGLVFGHGLIGIDVDDKRLLEFLKEFPDTYTESTPSGGLHLIFKFQGQAENKNLNFMGLHLGELRASRQYVVIAPSIAVSKVDGKVKPYKIIKDIAPATISAELLQGLLQNFSSMPSNEIKKDNCPSSSIKPHVGGVDRSVYDFAKCCELIEQGNITFFEVANQMRRFGSSKWHTREEKYRFDTYKHAYQRVMRQ